MAILRGMDALTKWTIIRVTPYQSTTLPKWMFSQNTFVQIILAAKWSVRHSTTTMAPTFAFSFVFILLLCFHFARQGIFTVCLIFYECVGVAMQHCSRLLASSQARGLLINMLATLEAKQIKKKVKLTLQRNKNKNIEYQFVSFPVWPKLCCWYKVNGQCEVMVLSSLQGCVFWPALCGCLTSTGSVFWSTLETRKWSILSFQITK